MRIPKKNVAGFANEIVQQCSASRNDRLQRGAMYRNLYLAGSQDGDPQTYLKTYSHIEKLSSYLYSPVELRFGVEFYGMSSSVDRAMGAEASSELHRNIRQSNVDTLIGDAVTWSLVKGKSFVKLLWSEDGFEPYLIQPEMMGVLREDLDTLDKQEAFFHTTYYTPERFAQLVEHREDRDEIMRKVMNNLSPDNGDAPDKANNIKQIVLGGLYPYKAAENGGAKGKSVVDWLGGPAPYLDPKVLKTLIRLDETWIWDDERDDWTTLQTVGENVLIEGKDRHRNIFADAFDPDDTERKRKSDDGNPLSGHHPFLEFCPARLDGYFWGRSEICNVAILQESINKRINGINAIMRRQEDPPYFISGSQGVNQNTFSKMKKPGGYLTETNPSAVAKSLAPEMPATLFQSLHELERMFDDIGGMSPILQGRGESGVRAQGHAETLVRTASPRFKDAALAIERQVETLGGLALDILKAKKAEKMIAWVMPKDETFLEKITKKFGLNPKNTAEIMEAEMEFDIAPAPGMKPVPFTFAQLPRNCKVVVDSHSSSPAFSHETRELLFELFSAGVITPEQLVTHVSPPGQDTIIEDLKRKDIAAAEFAAQHPEAAEKAAAGKKKKK
jgi:hypothetical protein